MQNFSTVTNAVQKPLQACEEVLVRLLFFSSRAQEQWQYPINSTTTKNCLLDS